MDSGRLVYLNGKFVSEREAKISIFDSALMFGDMVFEITRSFNKKQFKLKEHIQRLFYGIKIYRIPMKLTEKELEKICYETIEKNEPFFSTFFSLSSHLPFTLPKEYLEKNKIKKNIGIRETILYSDHAMSQFFHLAKKESWFKNTILSLQQIILHHIHIIKNIKIR